MAFGIFGKKKKKKDNRFLSLTIKEVTSVSKDAVNVVFEKPNVDFNYEPGQFITIIDQVNGEKVRRAYSLCTSPDLDPFPAVTVKRVEGGKMSNHINDTFSAGMEVEAMFPMGNFTTHYEANASRHLIFVGGGSGITPLFSMIKTALSKEPNSRIDLVYGNTQRDQVIFADELTQMSSQYSQFNVIHILESDESGFADYSGRPNPSMVGEIFDKINPQKDGDYFVCGPDGMMEMIKEVLHDKGIGPDRIKIESYSNSAEKSEEMSQSEEEGTCNATIELDGEVHELEIKMSKPVLEQALDAGLDMPYSCQSGLCTACRAKCLEGSVSTEKAEGLTQNEYDEGYVLLCVGKAKTNKISLEVG